jgi:hypothetical protein
MNVVIFSNTRTGSSCVAQWIADSLNIRNAEEFIGMRYLELSRQDDFHINNFDDKNICNYLLQENANNNPMGSVLKVMYHDFNIGDIGISMYGPFSSLLLEISQRPVVPIHLVRQDLLASSISSWLATKTRVFHKKTHNFSTEERYIPIIDTSDIDEILGEYEARIFSNCLAVLTLNYYFGQKLISIDYDDFQTEAYRQSFITKYFSCSSSAELAFNKVGTPTNEIKKLIQKSRIEDIQKKCLSQFQSMFSSVLKNCSL